MNTKTECPACGSNAFYYTSHNNLGYCFVCQHWRRGDEEVIDSVKRSDHIEDIREYYNRMAHYYHSCLDSNAYAFLTARGYTDKTIQQQKIGFCPSDGKSMLYSNTIAKEAGLATYDNKPFLSGRITFPYYYRGEVTDIRGRYVGKHDRKYLSPLHSAYYRGADYPYNAEIRHAKKVVITEGEIKSDLSTQAGFPCYGLPGMNAWRQIKQKEDQEIVICFDSQKDMRLVNRAIIKLAQRLDYPKIATLPLMGKDKQDIDGFIMEYGVDLYARCINVAIPYEQWFKLQGRIIW